MAWLWLEGCAFLCIGFSHGGVSVITALGEVCLTFLLLPQPCVHIRVDAQLLFLHEGNRAAGMQLSTLAAAVSKGRESDTPNLPHQLYLLSGRAETTDACFVENVMSLDDVFAVAAGPAIVALGARPFLSQHRLDGLSLRSMIGGAASAVMSFAKSWFRRDGRANAESEDVHARGQLAAGMLRAEKIKTPGIRAKEEDTSPAAQFVDPTRQGERLAPAPSGTVAVTCDAYGRVGLFCLHTLRCLYLWKGYREAQVAWLPVEEGFGLAIYAPRRGLLELWDIRDPGPTRVNAVTVDLEARLVSDCRGAAFLFRPDGTLERLLWRASAGHVPTPSELDSDAFNSLSEGGDTEPDETGGLGVDEFAQLTATDEAPPPVI